MSPDDEPESNSGESPHDYDTQLSAVVEAAPEGLLVVDGDGLITLLNRQAEELFGYARTELVGHPIEALIPARYHQAHETHRKGYLLRPRTRPMGSGLPLWGRRKDGREFPIDVSLSPIGSDDRHDVIALVRDMSERRATEERLAYLGAIVESTGDAIYGQDHQGRITSWNRSAERLFGYTSAEAIASEAMMLVPPARREDASAILGRILDGERVEHHETVAVRRGGMLVPVSETLSPIVGPRHEILGVVIVARDLSEQQVAQTTLAESEARLREGEALSHVGGWIWDAPADAVQWSDELHRIHGMGPFEFEGTLAAHLARIPNGDRERVTTEMQTALRANQPLQTEYRIVRPDGEVRWLYSRADPIRDDEGRHSGGLRGICQDITERHLAEEAMREAYERERVAAEELRSADALKDEFLATVSHELRTPLTAIIGFSTILAMDASPQHAPMVERLSRNAEEMSRMIERLLDFSRLEAGRVAFAPRPLRLDDCVGRTLKQLAEPLRRHTVETTISDGLYVEADPEALDRILSNLIINASKYAPEETTITVSGLAGDTWATVSVSDRGPGVPPDVRSLVFERFYQAPRQPAGKRGTGVGLSIVRRYVELHGGSIWYDETKTEGATFSFTLPQAAGPR